MEGVVVPSMCFSSNFSIIKQLIFREFCEDGGCCPIGEFCTGPPPGTITISRGGTFTFTSSDISFPSPTDVFTSSKFTSHSSFSVSSGDFGGPTPFPSPTSTPLPDAGSITVSIDAGFSTALNTNASDFPCVCSL